MGCPYNCIYCDQKAITNTSAIDFTQIERIVKEFCQHNYDENKEIAFYGGTFTNLEEDFIDKLLSITDPYISSKVSIRISTRPDKIFKEQLLNLSVRGLKTVELGIQSFSDQVLKQSGRGYSSQTAIDACQTIKECGLNLCIQLMPGLPGSDSISLQETITQIIAVKPDMVRIYPTIVLKNTSLEKMYNSGKYTPLTLQEAIAISTDMINLFNEEDIRVIKAGLHSDISKENIIAGPYHQSFGELIRIEQMLKKIIANYQKEKTFVISKYDVSLFKGFKQNLLKRIKAKLDLDKIPVVIDQQLNKGEIAFSDRTTNLIW